MYSYSVYTFEVLVGLGLLSVTCEHWINEEIVGYKGY